MSIAARVGTLLVVALLAGCGKTGDLYLPDRGGEVVTRPTATPPAEGTDEEAEKKKQQSGATSPPKPQQ